VSALPRATCPVCSKSVAVRRNGTLWEHTDHDPGKCPGSGQKP
jgi:hypothetical protein